MGKTVHLLIDERSDISIMKYYGSPQELTKEMRQLLSHGESFWLVVTGNSMSPVLQHEKDRVYISPLRREPKKGDILLAETYINHCLLHRVVKFDGERIILQGDALPYREGPFPKSCIVGIVTKFERNSRIITASGLYNKLVLAALRRITKLRRLALKAPKKILRICKLIK